MSSAITGTARAPDGIALGLHDPLPSGLLGAGLRRAVVGRTRGLSARAAAPG